MSLLTTLGRSLLNISYVFHHSFLNILSYLYFIYRTYRLATGESLTTKYFHFLTTGASSACKLDNVYTVATRSKIRWHFPRPNERRRVKRHGWWARMATPGGRRVLMNRILRGKHVYSH